MHNDVPNVAAAAATLQLGVCILLHIVKLRQVKLLLVRLDGRAVLAIPRFRRRHAGHAARQRGGAGAASDLKSSAADGSAER